MIKKCYGCGVTLQSNEKEKLGYTRNIDKGLCERCFRIKHYGDYQVVEKNNDEYLKILKMMNQTNDLVLFVIDLFNLNDEVYELAKMIQNPCLLVLTKRDLFAGDIYHQKFIDAVCDLPAQVVDTVMISSKNNFGFDALYEKINRYKKSKNVYIVGLTNAGKSTMLNQLLKHYSNKDTVVTTSMLPSTTIDMIKIKVTEELYLIDTPGILDHSIANVVSTPMLKKIVPAKTIRPITYQIKLPQTIIVENLLRIDLQECNSVTLFFSNQLKVKRFYESIHTLETLELHELDVPENSDIVISGFGFIKCKNACHVKVYTLKDVAVNIRKALI